MTRTHRKWLMQLTGLPTAAGCEDRVAAWLRAWVGRRSNLQIREDHHGNLEVRLPGVKRQPDPLYLVTHMDHPAFVVTEVVDDRHLVAEFRGGVARHYFRGSGVRLHLSDGRVVPGTVVKEVLPDQAGADRHWQIRLARPAFAAEHDILTWKLPPPRSTQTRLSAPACDNLAGVAAALAVLDTVRRDRRPPDLRLLLTRCEEVGFVGAVGVARSRTLPRAARLLVIENSRSFADSPLGGGPVVRVGDRTSTFDIEMTRAISAVAQSMAAQSPGFRWQRCLMPGGTCEATAFVAYGFRAACVCLPLENYHNMQGKPARIVSERIDLDDFTCLIRLLVNVARLVDGCGSALLKGRLETLFVSRVHLLGRDVTKKYVQ